jgi:acyl carrier protein
MGLDSVELLMSVEQKFGINIPDSESEQIETIQQLANSVYNYLSIQPSKKCISQILFYRIRNTFIRLNIIQNELYPDQKLSDLIELSQLETKWIMIEEQLELKLPKLAELDTNPQLSAHVEFLGFKTFKRSLPVCSGTVKQLIDWIISLNFNKLIDTKQITSLYEIERVICGITSEKLGIPINEIELKHSFTNDLGID